MNVIDYFDFSFGLNSASDNNGIISIRLQIKKKFRKILNWQEDYGYKVRVN